MPSVDDQVTTSVHKPECKQCFHYATKISQCFPDSGVRANSKYLIIVDFVKTLAGSNWKTSNNEKCFLDIAQ